MQSLDNGSGGRLLEDRQHEIDEDLSPAARVQHSLAPKAMTWANLRVEAHYNPMLAIGGEGGGFWHSPFGDSLFTPRNWKIVDELKRVAAEIDESPARIAPCWVLARPGVTSTLMGVSKSEQIKDNASALDIVVSADHRAALEAVSASADPRMLYSLFTPALRQHVLFGGCSVEAVRWDR